MFLSSRRSWAGNHLAHALPQENAAKGTYTVTRLLYMNTKGEPEGLTKAFVDYIYSPAGKEIVSGAGYIPYEKK